MQRGGGTEEETRGPVDQETEYQNSFWAKLQLILVNVDLLSIVFDVIIKLVILQKCC